MSTDNNNKLLLCKDMDADSTYGEERGATVSNRVVIGHFDCNTWSTNAANDQWYYAPKDVIQLEEVEVGC
jgi:hypothetical protein